MKTTTSDQSAKRMPRALVTGVTGQDGSFLTEFLLQMGYQVHGLVRPTSSMSTLRFHHFYHPSAVDGQTLVYHYADLEDSAALRRVILKVTPNEVYHLAGQSHVGLSYQIPESTCEVTAMGTLRLLEIIRDLPNPPRFFHASSSEIFGSPHQIPQDEFTEIAPVSPYGCAKAFATQLVRTYRTAYDLFLCNGIMYNHESLRRAESFVTRKVCRSAARIKFGLQSELLIGDTSAVRDWGHARDYVRGMWLSLQHKTPEDFVFATGQLHRVQDVIELAFSTVDLDWRKYVKQDPLMLRVSERRQLVGNATKARRLLGWEPRSGFRELITEMTIAELKALKTLGDRDSVSTPKDPGEMVKPDSADTWSRSSLSCLNLPRRS
jgi:GDPmannose 4,6-dehydratase